MYKADSVFPRSAMPLPAETRQAAGKLRLYGKFYFFGLKSSEAEFMQ